MRSAEPFARRFKVAPALLGAAWLLSPSLASAQAQSPVELNWNAPERCPSSDEVLARVRALVGKKRVVAGPIKAEGTITERADGQLRLRLITHSGALESERNVESGSCKDLAGAAAVSLAILLSSEKPTEQGSTDQGSSSSTTSEVDGGSTTTPAAPSTDSKKPAGSEPATPSADPAREGASLPRAERRWHVLLTAPAAALRLGPEHDPSRGLAFAVGVAFDRWRVLAGAKIWASQNATKTRLLDEYRVDLDRFTVDFRGCRDLGASSFMISPCVVVSAQHLSTEGEGPRIVPQTESVTWLSAGIGLQGRARITSWLQIVARVDGELQFSRPKIKLEGVGVVEQLGPAAATLLLGPEWIL